jgi:Uma2 family endonuclease
VVAQPSPPTLSVEEWRELERTSHDVKHEYIDGSVYAMAGGTLDHSQIAINVIITLTAALADGPCRVYNSDAAARLSPARYTYPDATVTCDERDRGQVTEIQAPRVIVEVLSPDSTEAFDRGRKFAYYRACPTVQEYVLVNTTHRAVEVFRRTSEGWTVYHAYGADETVELTSIEVRVAVSALYARTEVPEFLAMSDGEV